MSEIPTKPYLLRALYEWCVDNGYTPHLAVKVDAGTQVPADFVKNGEITLNISAGAVHKMQMGNELIEFSARFAGAARQISVPVANVYAVYARETGHGMTFDIEAPKPGSQPAAEAEPLAPLSPVRAPGGSERRATTPIKRPSQLAPAARGAGAPTDQPPRPSGPKPTLRRVK